MTTLYLFVCVSFFLLGCSRATILRPLTDIGSFIDTFHYTANMPSPVIPPVLNSITYPTVYDSSAANLAPFAVKGEASFTDPSVVDAVFITITNGDDSVYCTATVSEIVDSIASFDTNGECYLKLLHTATYSVSVQMHITNAYYPITVTLPGDIPFPTVTAVAYQPPAVTLLELPEQHGCWPTSCTGPLEGSLAFTNDRPSFVADVMFIPANRLSNGVMYYIETSPLNTGEAQYTLNALTPRPLSMVVGGVDALGRFEVTLNAGHTFSVPSDPMSPSLQLTENTYRSTYFPVGHANALFPTTRYSVGTNDTTAPTCSTVTVKPTPNPFMSNQADFVVSCQDEIGGSGLWTRGVFVTWVASYDAEPVTWVFQTTNGYNTSSIPGYVNGTLTIVGVFAIDLSGNAVLYGSCGSATKWDSLCAPPNVPGSLAFDCHQTVFDHFDAMFGRPPKLQPYYIVYCPASGTCASTGGDKAEIWGSQGWYTLDSDVCLAQRHSTGQNGGYSILQFDYNLFSHRVTSFDATLSNGIQSRTWADPYPVIFHLSHYVPGTPVETTFSFRQIAQSSVVVPMEALLGLYQQHTQSLQYGQRQHPRTPTRRFREMRRHQQQQQQQTLSPSQQHTILQPL